MTAPRPLFVDTNALVAVFNRDDQYHESANAVLNGIRDGSLAYGPVFTSRFVLSETATTLRYGIGHREAVEALDTVRESSSFNIIDVTEPLFSRAVDQFAAYDDQTISLVDHLNSILCGEFGIDHIFAFEDDFRTLGLLRVPVDTNEP